ncbi:MAG: DUF3145 domain-containing protein [Promicromonosporaceae bacterium]|nr:DUF3145 domain-containing protein [Promicromonosporaceae bacterium]
MSGYLTSGVLFVHSAPRALCPHIEWAAGNVLGESVSFDWTEQPAARGLLRAEYSWAAGAGTGAQLASALRGWEHLRYEVTEDASYGSDGARWSHTPELGIFYSQADVHGNVVISEDRVRRALAVAHDARAMRSALDLALGTAWDDELEPFRYAGAGAPVRWLHRVS